MPSKAERRAAKKARAAGGRAKQDGLVLLVQAQDEMLGVRNRILQRLAHLLTDEERESLSRVIAPEPDSADT